MLILPLNKDRPSHFIQSIIYPDLIYHANTRSKQQPFILIYVTLSSLMCPQFWDNGSTSPPMIPPLYSFCLSKSPTSILFLEEMYKTPFSTVFNLQWQSQSKKKINDSLTTFQKRFDAHPFATPGSMAYRKLEYLGQLIQRWFKNDDLTTNPVDVVSCLTFFEMFPLAFMI